LSLSPLEQVDLHRLEVLGERRTRWYKYIYSSEINTAMKSPPIPYTITSPEGETRYYCKVCDAHKPGGAFHNSALAARRRCCKRCARNRKNQDRVAKMLRSVRRLVAATDKELAGRWELQDVLNILARGRSNLSGKTSEKYSIVRDSPNIPWTPSNSLLVTRREAMGRRHLCRAN